MWFRLRHQCVHELNGRSEGYGYSEDNTWEGAGSLDEWVAEKVADANVPGGTKIRVTLVIFD